MRPRRSPTRAASSEGLIALAFLSPSIVIFVIVLLLPASSSWCSGASTATTPRGRTCATSGWSQYSDVLRRRGLPLRPPPQRPVRDLHRAAGLILGTALAVAANRRLKGIKVFQAIFSSTIATSAAVASVVFFILFNPQVGIIKGGVPGFGDQALLDNPSHRPLRRVAVVGVAEPGPLVRHRAGRAPGHPRGGRRGRDPRRLRAAAPLLPDHPAPPVAGAAVPASSCW